MAEQCYSHKTSGSRQEDREPRSAEQILNRTTLSVSHQ